MLQSHIAVTRKSLRGAFRCAVAASVRMARHYSQRSTHMNDRFWAGFRDWLKLTRRWEATVRHVLFGPEKPHFTGCVAYRASYRPIGSHTSILK
jgi:hypothetical protein